MVDFKEQLKLDAVELARPDEFGEEVTVHFDDGRDPKTVRAVVDRNVLTQDSRTGIVARTTTVSIPNDETHGVTSWADGDQIELVPVLGEEAKRFRYTKLVSQSEAWFVVEAQS